MINRTCYKYLAFAVLQAGAFIVSPLLPVEAGWENGPIEIVQTILLFLGALGALWCWHSCNGTRFKALWLTFALVWLVLLVKELGWGVVFMDPLAHSNETGPGFSSSVQLWYKPAVVIVLGVLALVWVAVFFVTRQSRTVIELYERKALPVTEIIIVSVLMILSSAAEGNLGWSTGLTPGSAQIYEELVELLAYVALLLAQYRVIQARLDAPHVAGKTA